MNCHTSLYSFNAATTLNHKSLLHNNEVKQRILIKNKKQYYSLQYPHRQSKTPVLLIFSINSKVTKDIELLLLIFG